jgi:hypothetical protein
MHAVVLKVSINDLDTATQFLNDQVVPRASAAPGFVAGYWTRSADNSNGLSMVVFESEEAARAASEQLQSTEPEGVTIDNVELREVVASA